MKPHRLAVFGLAAGLLGGGAAGLALTGTTLASAQVSDVTGTVTDPAATTDSTVAEGDSTTTTEAPTTTSDPAASEAPAATSDPSTTTTPSDPATPAPATPDPAAGAEGPKGDCGRDGRGHGVGDLNAAAQALGMTADELRTALQGGKSLADVAKEKGIDVSKVVDALVAQLKAHLDQEVAEGEHTQAEADQRLADAKTRIEALVNGTAPAGGFGFGGRHGGHGPGHFGPGPRGGAPAPAAGSSGSGTSGTTTS
jgi:hypothetical protein